MRPRFEAALDRARNALVANHADRFDMSVTEIWRDEARRELDGQILTVRDTSLTMRLRVEIGGRSGHLQVTGGTSLPVDNLVAAFMARVRETGPPAILSEQLPKARITAAPLSALDASWTGQLLDDLTTLPSVTDSSATSQLRARIHLDSDGQRATWWDRSHIVDVGLACLRDHSDTPILRFRAETPDTKTPTLVRLPFRRFLRLADLPLTSLTDGVHDAMLMHPWALRSYLDLLLHYLSGPSGYAISSTDPAVRALPFDLLEGPNDPDAVGAVPFDDYGAARTAGTVLQGGQLTLPLLMHEQALGQPGPYRAFYGGLSHVDLFGRAPQHIDAEFAGLHILNAKLTAFDQPSGRFTVVCTGYDDRAESLVQFIHRDQIAAFLASAIAIGSDADHAHAISTPAMLFPTLAPA